MSWLYSQALVAEYSAASCSDGTPSALLNGESTPLAYCAPDKMKAFSRLSRFGMMFSPLTDDHGAALLTWYLAASPARTSALPEKAQASMASARACGATWLGSLGKYDPASRSWRTAQRSFLGDLEESLATWPRSGMTAAGECWELPTLEPTTSGTDSGLWLPTPTASSAGTNGKSKCRETGAWINGKPSLNTMATQNTWPTPNARDYQGAPGAGCQERGGHQSSLPAKVKMFHTPTTNGLDGGSNSRKASIKRGDQVPSGGTLNPMWVEKLMMWPDDWTSINPISHVKMCFWLMGLNHGQERRTEEVLRVLRQGNAAQEVRGAIGRFVSIPEAAVLLSDVCEHQNRPDEARIFMACAEALEKELRGVRLHDGVTCPSCGPGQHEQRPVEYPDALRALSQLLAHHGQAHQKDGRWEDATPRIANGVAARVDRLKAIGNGQVPLCAATAWRLLGGPIV